MCGRGQERPDRQSSFSSFCGALVVLVAVVVLFISGKYHGIQGKANSAALPLLPWLCHLRSRHSRFNHPLPLPWVLWVCCSPSLPFSKPATPRVYCLPHCRCRTTSVALSSWVCRLGSATSASPPQLHNVGFVYPDSLSHICVIPPSRPHLSHPTFVVMCLCAHVFWSPRQTCAGWLKEGAGGLIWRSGSRGGETLFQHANRPPSDLF